MSGLAIIKNCQINEWLYSMFTLILLVQGQISQITSMTTPLIFVMWLNLEKSNTSLPVFFFFCIYFLKINAYYAVLQTQNICFER